MHMSSFLAAMTWTHGSSMLSDILQEGITSRLGYCNITLSINYQRLPWGTELRGITSTGFESLGECQTLGESLRVGVDPKPAFEP